MSSNPVQEQEEPQICDACGKPKYSNKDLLKCGRCKQTFYHDKTCQVKHWPQHKVLCRQFVTQMQQKEEFLQHSIQLITIEDSDDKGRVVSATKNLAAGETTLLEQPAILFDTRLEYLGLLEAFGKSTKEIQEKILDLHAPPLQEIDSNARQQRHARLEQQLQAYLQQHPEQASILTTATTQKLLAIVETNAHQLFNANLLPGSEGIDPMQWMGLFCMGSMLEHSCSPSLTMNTTRDGKLELIAETNIASGERVSFSYIEGVYEKCRAQRQAQLLEEKHFVCQCDRCCSIDECRPVVGMECPICNEDHPLFWDESQKGYICVMTEKEGKEKRIETLPESILQQDVSFCNQIQSLETSLEQGEKPIDEIFSQLIRIMSRVDFRRNIHPLHWLRVSAYQLLSKTSSIMARM